MAPSASLWTWTEPRAEPPLPGRRRPDSTLRCRRRARPCDHVHRPLCSPAVAVLRAPRAPPSGDRGGAPQPPPGLAVRCAARRPRRCPSAGREPAQGPRTQSFSTLSSYQKQNSRWRPVFALDTSGLPNTDGQDFEEDSGFLGRTRLGRLIQAAARELLEKLNSGRTNSPTKIFLLLLGFYTANALSTILGQTGDWDVLVSGVIVAAIEGIGMLMYKRPNTRPTGRFQSLIAKVNYWKAGVCLGLFVDAFKVGS
ncbi:hypothetical protein ACP4OV_014130 [Aristida adscensionis]